MVETLAITDIACLVVYFMLVLVVGIWATCRSNRTTTMGYFLSGKQMHWFLIGASIFSSQVGAHMFVGLAGAAAASGFAVLIYEWHALFLLIALGWIVLPVYSACGAYTTPEYLKKRYGGNRLCTLFSVLTLLNCAMTSIPSEILSGAIFMQRILGWNIYASTGGILAVTIVYTFAGGLSAVMYTNAVQAVILIGGAGTVFFLSFIDLGNWDDFIHAYGKAASNATLNDLANKSCGLPRADFEHIWRSTTTGDIPWPGAVIGLTAMGFSAWCTGQIVVQRCLAAKNLSHAKAGAVFAGCLKILPLFLFVIPGMISRVLFPDEIACSDPITCKEICGNEAGCSNLAYPLLMLRKLPAGCKGVMLAALLAGLMGNLTAIFNSASAIVTMDIWRWLRRKAGQGELMVVGRLNILLMIGISIMWIPVMQESDGGQMWTYAQSIAACFSPAFCWVFLLGIFWKGTTEKGAFWGLTISASTGIVRLVLQLMYFAPFCGSSDEDRRPKILKDVHFLHFAIIVSVITMISIVVISLFTQKRTPKQLRRVTWWTRHDSLDDNDLNVEDDEVDDKHDENNDNKITFNIEIEEPKAPIQLTFKTRFFFWLCGVDNRPKPKLNKEERMAIMKKMTDIRESSAARTAVNAAAILSVLFLVYLIGMFH